MIAPLPLPKPNIGMTAPGGPAPAPLLAGAADLASLFAALIDAARPPDTADDDAIPADAGNPSPDDAPADLSLLLPAWLLAAAVPPPLPVPSVATAMSGTPPDASASPANLPIPPAAPTLLASASPDPAAPDAMAEGMPGDTAEAEMTTPAPPMVAAPVPPVAAVAAAPRASAADLARQIAPVLPRVVADGEDQVLTLDPASLGRVTLRWVTDGSRAPLIRMVAERADTMALLAAHEGGLNRLLGGDGNAAPQLRVDRMTAPALPDQAGVASGGSAGGGAGDSRAPSHHQPQPTQVLTRRAVKAQQRAGEADQADAPLPPRRAERFA